MNIHGRRAAAQASLKPFPKRFEQPSLEPLEPRVMLAADLVVQVTGAVPTSAFPGEEVRVAWEVTNQGDTPTLTSWMSNSVYFSADDVLDTGADRWMYEDDAPLPILAGQSLSYDEVLRIPDDLLWDQGYLLFAADTYNDEAEGNEANNVQAVPIDLVWGSIEATAYDLARGAPAEGVTIQVHQGNDPDHADDGAWQWVTSAQTDAFGGFRIDGLPPRHYRLHVEDGQSDSAGNHYISADLFDVVVFDGAVTSGLNLDLREAGSVWGYVYNDLGAPIPNAEVVMGGNYTEDGEDWWHSAYTDGAGRYDLYLPPSDVPIYPLQVTRAGRPGEQYQVYATGDRQVWDGIRMWEDLAGQGMDFLGSGIGTQSFPDGYRYYALQTLPGHQISVDAVQDGSGGYYDQWNMWGSNVDWDSLDDVRGAPDGQYGRVNADWWQENYGGIAWSYETPPGTVTIHVAGEAPPADPTWYGAQLAPGLYAAELNGGTRGPDFHLDPGATLKGRVITDDGAPVGETHVLNMDVQTPEGVISILNGYTDQDGYWTTTSIPAGTEVILNTAEWPWEDFAVDGKKYAWPERWAGVYDLAPGEVLDLGDMVVPQAGRVRGVVTDKWGNPVVGAEIWIVGRGVFGGEIDIEDVTTDALGQFDIEWVPPGRVSLTVEKEGWLPRDLGEILTVFPGSEVVRDVRLSRADEGFSLAGEIANYDQIAPTNANGDLLPWRILDAYDNVNLPWGLGVMAFDAGTPFGDNDILLGSEIDRWMTGDEDAADGFADYFQPGFEPAGSFELDLPAGDHILIAWREGWTYHGGGFDLFSDPIHVSGSAGQEVEGLQVTIPIGSATIEGQLVFPVDYPTPTVSEDGAVVLLREVGAGDDTLGRAIAWPNAIGGYFMGDVPAGRYYLSAAAHGVAPVVSAPFTVGEGGSLTRNIVFSYGATAVGEVISGGAHVVGAVVSSAATGFTAVTDATGQYRLTGLEAGADTLTVSAPGFADDATAVVLVDGGETTANFELTSSAATLTGQVYNLAWQSDGIDNNQNGQADEPGEGVFAGVTVVAYNTGRTESAEVRTDSQGEFLFDGLVAGDYMLAAHLPGMETVVYPPGGGVLVIGPSAEVDLADLAPDHIELDYTQPEFSVTSTVEAGVLNVTFFSDVDLNAGPNITIVTGGGTITAPAPGQGPLSWQADYTIDPQDTLVQIRVGEDPAGPIIPGNPAGRTFGFDVGEDLLEHAGTTFYNAEGAEVHMMGAQDDSSVYVPPFALVGDGVTEALTLTASRYGEPGDQINGDAQGVSSVYDFSFTDDGQLAEVELTHEATITLSFVPPAGMGQAEFESTLSVGFFNEAADQWVWNDLANSNPGSGLSDIRVNWAARTATFKASHFTKFVAAIEGGVDGPDLVGAFGTITLGEVAVPGDKGTFSVAVTNVGNQDAVGRMAMALYGSTDQTLDGGDVLMARLTNVAVKLKPQQTKVYKVKLVIPADTAAGTYYMLAAVDVDDDISEANELNNLAVTEDTGEVAWKFGNFAGRSNVRLTVADADGTPVMLSLKGAGAGEVIGGSAFTEVKLTGVNASTSVTIAARAKGQTADIVDLTADGDMRAVVGKTVRLGGDVDIAGTVGKLTLGDVADDHVINIGGGATSKAITVALGRVANTVLTSLSPIKALTVIEWLDDNAVADAVNAPVIGKLTSKGAKANAKKNIEGSAGHFQADLHLDGAGATKATLGSATIAGDLDDADWDITGLVGKLTVRRTARNSTVRSTGSIGGIALGAADGSDFLAGMKASVARHGQGAADFQDTSVGIKSFKIAGLKMPKGAVGALPRWFFTDSNVSAAWIGAVSLLNVNFENQGTGFGVWAADTTPGNEIKSVKWSDKVDKDNNGKWPPRDGQLFNEPDLAIEML